MIRVLVADDHPIVRSGIVALLSSADDFDVVAEAADGREAVDVALVLRPDLVLMDLRMPILGGDEATAEILSRDPAIRIVVLTTYDTDDAILPAIEAGASGYLLKAAPEEEILAGLRSVARGEVALAPTIAAMLVRRVAAGAGRAGAGGGTGAGASGAAGTGGGAGGGAAAGAGRGRGGAGAGGAWAGLDGGGGVSVASASDPAVVLTEREVQVLALVAQGRSNRAAADELFVSEATVKTHLLHVFEKLGVRDRTRAVTLAMELGLLPR